MQDNLMAESLEISSDIYNFPKVNQAAKGCSTKEKSANAKKEEGTSIANIMAGEKVVNCPCCNDAKETMLASNPIFVEQREGADPVFLDEEEIQTTMDYDLEQEQQEKKDPELPTHDDVVSSQIMALIKEDNFFQL